MYPWIIWGGLIPLHKMQKAIEIDEPPELYYIMRSIVDYKKKYSEQTPIQNLADVTREVFFYDYYPLNSKVNKSMFEIDILNHFLHRRIAYDTVTGFKIALINKLREIMPKYNLMFDLYMDDDVFYDIENEKFNSEKVNVGGYTNNNNGGYNTEENTGHVSDVTEQKNTTENLQSIETENKTKTEDLRYSDTPQNRLSDIQNGSYISEYRYNQIKENNTTNTNSNKTGSEKGNTHGIDTGNKNTVNTHNDTDGNTHNDTDTFNHAKENRKKTNLIDKIKIIEEFKNIMSMIYSDLDCLFLQVYDY